MLTDNTLTSLPTPGSNNIETVDCPIERFEDDRGILVVAQAPEGQRISSYSVTFAEDNTPALAAKTIPSDTQYCGPGALPCDSNLQRVFIIYGVPVGTCRCRHLHRRQNEEIVCLRGSFELRLDKGDQTVKSVPMTTSAPAVMIPNGLRLMLYDFSEDAVCLVRCPDPYDPDDNLE